MSMEEWNTKSPRSLYIIGSKHQKLVEPVAVVQVNKGSLLKIVRKEFSHCYINRVLAGPKIIQTMYFFAVFRFNISVE